MTDRIPVIHAFHTFGEALREAFDATFPGREYVVWTREDEFVAGIGDAEVLLAMRPPRGHWERARRLRLVQMGGAGVDAILPSPDLSSDVVVTNARGIHEPEMSEFGISLVLALAKGLHRAMQQQRDRTWRMFGMRTLAGRTLGVLGLGTIGHAVAQRGAALGMRVIGTRRTPEPLAGVDRVYPPSETERVLRESDAVVLLLPLTDETRGLLDAKTLACMKPRAHLVNLARGGIVDESALAEALRDGRIGAAACDVFEEEPLPESSPLWDAPNLLITPHLAGVSRDYMSRLGGLFFDNVTRLERGEPLRNVVDVARGY